MTINGNLTVLGAQTAVNTTSLEVKDNAILIADDNNADTIESGIMVQYKPSGSSAPKYAGMKRLPETGEFVFFKDANDKIAEPAAPAAAAPILTDTIRGMWIEFALSSPAEIASYGYSLSNGPEVRPYLNSWSLIGSNDQTSWYLIDTQLNATVNGAKTVDSCIMHNVAQPYSFSHIRFIIRGLYNPNNSTNATFSNLILRKADGSFITGSMTTHSIQGWIVPPVFITSTTFGGSDGVFFNDPSWMYSGPTGTYLADISSTVITSMPVSSSLPTDVYATVLADSFNCASDARLKKDIKDLDSALDKMDKIRGVTYHWIDESQPKDLQVGVIAQEIQSVYPELVREGGNGFLSVDYPKLTAVLIQSVKELKAMVLDLVAAKQQQ
jgi:hypothetical protein